MFLEILPVDDPNVSLPNFDKENDVLLFLKMYDPLNESIHYQGHITIPITSNFRKSFIFFVSIISFHLS